MMQNVMNIEGRGGITVYLVLQIRQQKMVQKRGLKTETGRKMREEGFMFMNEETV